MAQPMGHGPRAKLCARLPARALTMKFTSPWRYSVTFFERCRATALKPRVSNSLRQRFGIGRGVLHELEAVGAHRVVVCGGGRAHGVISRAFRAAILRRRARNAIAFSGAIFRFSAIILRF